MNQEVSTFFEHDPALWLWRRVPDIDLQIVFPLLSRVPVPVGEIASNLGLTVIATSQNPSISGSIRKVSEAPKRFEVTVNITDNRERQRFTVAHEIAHYLLHRDDIDAEGINDTILFRSELSDAKEAQANKLASSILLPWFSVNSWCQQRFAGPPEKQHLNAIANAFAVSALAVGYRFGF